MADCANEVATPMLAVAEEHELYRLVYRLVIFARLVYRLVIFARLAIFARLVPVPGCTPRRLQLIKHAGANSSQD